MKSLEYLDFDTKCLEFESVISHPTHDLRSGTFERNTTLLKKNLPNILINKWHFNDRRFSTKNLWSDHVNPRKTIWEINCDQLQIPFY